MPTVDTLVIGAGQAGLATSRLLTEAGRDHVVLERGHVGERWRTERWDSLRMVTPNWMLRLPGSRYAGPEQDGYTSASRFVAMLEDYAASFAAPLMEGVDVREVRASGRGHSRYTVITDDDTWYARDLVVATGPHGRPFVPRCFDARGLGEVAVVAARDYRNPDRIAPGGVLVVGASASGVQIADELARAGRPVTLAVGHHTRMPRTYRGLDVYWWLEATGRLARTLAEHPDPDAARREPSLQLTGHRRGDRPDSTVDLAALQARGVRLTGRLAGLSGAVARLADDLPERLAEADTVMHRFLDAVDRYVGAVGLSREVWEPVRPAPVRVAGTPATLDLGAEGITTVVLATGYRPDHSWLNLPVLAADGGIIQRGGVTDLPGVYTVGQRFQVTRASGLVAGAGQDAAAVVDHLLGRPTEARVAPESAA